MTFFAKFQCKLMALKRFDRISDKTLTEIGKIISKSTILESHLSDLTIATLTIRTSHHKRQSWTKMIQLRCCWLKINRIKFSLSIKDDLSNFIFIAGFKDRIFVNYFSFDVGDNFLGWISRIWNWLWEVNGIIFCIGLRTRNTILTF